MGYTEKVAVIGAGISGLACAFRLAELGLGPRVYEAEGHAGGVIETVRRNGFLFETGPQSPRFPEPVWKLVLELGLADKFVAGDPKAKRYVLRDGRLHLAPFSPGGLIATRLVKPQSKLRILAEVLGNTSPPEQEESLAQFVERKFGKDVLDYLVDPVISTVFFGDSQKMGMESAFPALVEWERKHGSLVRGALRSRKGQNGAKSSTAPKPIRSSSHSEKLRVTDSLPSLGSFKAGMGTLPEKLAEKLKENIRYRERVECIAPSPGENASTSSGWKVRLQNGQEIQTESLVLAVPAYAAASLLENTAPQLASLLNAIEYAPVCTVSSAYDRRVVSHNLNGFGFMVPRRESLETICTFWNSSLLEGHAPEGQVVMTSFAGRDANQPLFAMSEDECAQKIEAENAKILGITGTPIDRMVWRSAKALPQYNIGHARRAAQVAEMLRSLPNLYLAGNYLTGRSIGDCVQIAYRIAEDLHSQVHR